MSLKQITAEVLGSLPQHRPIDRVFPVSSPHYLRVVFERARKRSGIADFCFHDLRHTAASWIRVQVADIHTVAQLP